jgi:uncharacterized protein YbjT (DUF2867 family)
VTETVLLIGSTGQLGGHFARELRARAIDVLALLRPEGEADPVRAIRVDALRRDGVRFAAEDLDDDSSLESACGHADVVISCIDHRPDHLRLQAKLVQAAKAAGVRRFVPSQFGIDSRTYAQDRVGHGDAKRDLQAVFDSSGLPTTYVHINGLATAWAISLGQLGLTAPPADAVDVYGAGDVPLSMVTPRDVARYTISALDDPRTEGRHVCIMPPENRLTQEMLVRLWESLTGFHMGRRHIGLAELDSVIDNLRSDPARVREVSLKELVRAVWFDGLGDGRRRDDVLELTDLYPDLGYTRIDRFLDDHVPVHRERFPAGHAVSVGG